MDCTRFYELRNRRTVEYLPDWTPPTRTVAVSAGDDAATTRAGQLCLLALANQLARVHRRLVFHLPDDGAELSVPSPFGGGTLGEALLRTCFAVDPCGRFDLVRTVPSDAFRIGIGRVPEGEFHLYAGADAWVGSTATSPLAVAPGGGSIWGGAVASVLAAAETFSALLGHEPAARRVSAWDWNDGLDCASGPRDNLPVDVGRVLVVGAGAVGSSLAYWLRMLGAGGSWVVVDGDQVELHNTNRSLALTPQDAGWPDAQPRLKAKVVASLLPSAEAYGRWYDEWVGTDDDSRDFDVVLALANERGVRHALTQRLPSIMLHATTGGEWMAQLHRHIAGLDDCITCRMDDLPEPVFECSGGVVEEPDRGSQADAALPFLSGAAGLMLASALARLQRGALHDHRANDWRLRFRSPHRFTSNGRRRCSEGCATWAPPDVRRAVAAGRRWAHLDPAYLSDA